MSKKLLSFVALFSVLGMLFTLTACSKPAKKTEDKATTQTADSKTEEKTDDKKDVEAPGEAGFEEFDIGEEQEVGPLTVGGVYFQPVDMEPAGNSLSKEESDCHMECDVHANEKGAELGYGVGDFVPWLKVKAYLQKEGSDKVQEIAFMPMNASDGPHYGANVKFEEGLGKYNVKFVISAPGNDYLLHVDKETGVTGRFWTEPITVEWNDFEWKGPQW